MALPKLFAVHSIKRTIEPAVIKQDAFGNEKIVKKAVTAYVRPGTLFDPIDDDEAADLKAGGAARDPTRREMALAGLGLLEGDSPNGGASVAEQKTQAEIDAAAAAQADADAKAEAIAAQADKSRRKVV